MSKTYGYVLLSGGIDSTTALTFAMQQLGRNNVACLSVNYGQRHVREIEYAHKVSKFYGRPHFDLLIEGMPQTMLTDPDSEIPNVGYSDLPHGISPTYVPFRNGQLLSKAAGYIQAWLKGIEGSSELPYTDAILYFGAHAEDSQNWAYPDCTPEFVGAMANAIFIGTYEKVRLVVPWQHYRKSEIIEYGAKHKTPYHLTWSCYKGEELHCGVCPTCRARKEAFDDTCIEDPTEYAT
jgi:7-cyano-7-deazaguanine synthase